MILWLVWGLVSCWQRSLTSRFSPGLFGTLSARPSPDDAGQAGTAGSAAPGHLAVLRVPSRGQSPHLAPHRGCDTHGTVPGTLSPLLSHHSRAGAAPRAALPRGSPAPGAPRPFCLFLHYFPAPPTLSLPLLLSLAFVPSLLFPSLLPEAFPHLQSLLRLPSLCQLSIDPLFSISGQLS